MTSITNADRVLFPDQGVTKGELVGHYELVADRLLPHIAGRPLTLERYPSGIDGAGFMQKNAPKGHPPTIEICVVPKREGDTRHPMVADRAGLGYLANLATISLHVPGATCSDLWHPDRLVFDLDPPEGSSDIGTAALEFRDHLESLGLPSVPLATGSKGFHLVTFIERGPEASDIAQAAQGCAELAVRRRPDLFTVQFKKADRAGKVFVDWLRNSVPATTIAPYSIRPLPRAPMATPLAWAEVADHGPRGTTLRTAAARLAGPDPWERAVQRSVDLTPFLARVSAALTKAGIELRPFDRFGR
jgi:bifunctional non-homologous end joining protein LigD